MIYTVGRDRRFPVRDEPWVASARELARQNTPAKKKSKAPPFFPPPNRGRGRAFFLARLSRWRFISGSRKTNGEIVSKILTAHLGGAAGRRRRNT